MPTPDYKLLFESAPDIYLVLAPDFTMVAASEARLRVTMTEREAIIGRNLFDLFPDNPDDAAATGVSNLRTSLMRVLKTKQPDSMAIQKYDIQKPPEEGGGFEERFWSPINSPVLGADGEVAYIIHKVEDVTTFVRLREQRERDLALTDPERLAAELLRRAQDVQNTNRRLDAAKGALEDRHRQIMDRAEDGFLTANQYGLIRDANRAAEEMFGAGRGELAGRVVDQLLSGEGQDRSVLEELDLVPSVQVEVPRTAGPLYLEVSVSSRTPFENEEITMVRLHDVTERIVLEQQLRQAQKLEAVGQLTGGVAHDFNNLLTVITSTIDILREGVADRPKLAALAAAIDESAERGAQLTQRLLAFARKQPLQPVAVNLNEIVKRSLIVLERTLGGVVTVETALNEEPWAAMADPGQVEDAILNLAINARDAMPEGGRIVIETRNVTLDEDYAATNLDVTPGDYVALIVTDSGCGMTQAVIDRVFEPFFTTKDVGRGSGLGLSMVYGFIKQSRGHIKVYSEVGIGTSVKLYLPRSGKAVATEAVRAPTPARAVSRQTVLVVEDNAAVRAATSEIVEGLGYTVRVAEDGPQALTILRSREPIDIMFTDVMMPNGLNGIELMRLAREVRPDLKVLLTSGYTERFVGGEKAHDLGARLLTKPYRRHHLADALRQALED